MSTIHRVRSRWSHQLFGWASIESLFIGPAPRKLEIMPLAMLISSSNEDHQGESAQRANSNILINGEKDLSGNSGNPHFE